MCHTDAKLTRKKHPVPYKEFDRLMLAIREQTRDYPQEALEDQVRRVAQTRLPRHRRRFGVRASSDWIKSTLALSIGLSGTSQAAGLYHASFAK
jgi:hypothetical protein